MGLDLTIYKENKKGKRKEVAYFGNAGWPVVTYFSRKLNKDLCDAVIPIDIDDVRELIECCKEILLAYYNRSFDNPNSWRDVAIAVFDSYKEEDYDEYDNFYIENITEIYMDLWKIHEEFFDDEKLILDINY